MGIDDVDFLKQNAFKEEYIAVIDSAKRDKVQYPTPTEYVVEFNAPFENVYGIDIIDVTVPRSGYIVDFYNNTLVFRFLVNAGYSDWITATLKPGNYTEATLITELNRLLRDPLAPFERFVTVSQESTPFSKTKKLKFSSVYTFEFDITRSLARTVIGFSDVALGADTTGSVFPSETSEDSLLLFSGPVTSEDVAPATRDKYLMQHIQARFAGFLTRITLKIGKIGYPPPNAQLTLRVDRITDTGLELVFSHVVLNPNDGETREVFLVANQIPVLFDQTYIVTVYDPVNDDINNCWGIYHGPTENLNTLFMSELGYTDLYYAHNHQMGISLALENRLQAIIPPGIVDLFGERYIQLRCPEIEEHMHRNRAYELHNVGLAIINTSREYETLNQKFVMLPSRTFHPIGKLKRMTFRFETSAGFPYNFNGIDHTVTMVIRYYRVKEVSPMTRYVHNPNYRPNFLEYIHDRESDDDEDAELFAYNDARARLLR